jgi:hypothetical protein
LHNSGALKAGKKEADERMERSDKPMTEEQSNWNIISSLPKGLRADIRVERGSIQISVGP